MAVIDTITIGSDTFDVYARVAGAVADADSYFNGRLGASDWTGATTDDKGRALAQAAEWMDRAVTYSGAKTVSTQSRQWPRDGAKCGSEVVADGTIPDAIAIAEYELALVLLGDAEAGDSNGQGSNVKRAKAGPAEVEFFSSTKGSADDTKLPQPAHDYLKCYLSGASGISASLSSGTDASVTDQATQFCSDGNSFNTNEGF